MNCYKMPPKHLNEKHILNYKDDELTKEILENNSTTQYFFTKVLKFKINNKVFKDWNEGIDGDDYISLIDAKNIIPNLNDN